MKLSGKLAEKGLHAFDAEPHVHAGIPIPRLWIVVADREKAHVYRKTPKKIEQIAHAQGGHAKSRPDEEGAGGVVFHGYDTHSEKKNHEDSAFIQKFAEWLDVATKEGVFDRLVLVAPPHTLGDIRACLSKPVQDRIVTEVNKDLVKLSDKEIEEHLEKIAWF